MPSGHPRTMNMSRSRPNIQLFTQTPSVMPNARNTRSNTRKLRSAGATAEITLSTVAGGTKATKTTKSRKLKKHLDLKLPGQTHLNASKTRYKRKTLLAELLPNRVFHDFHLPVVEEPTELPGFPRSPPPEPAESHLPSLSPARPTSEPAGPHLPSRSPPSLLDNNNAKIDEHPSDKEAPQLVGGGTQEVVENPGSGSSLFLPDDDDAQFDAPPSEQEAPQLVKGGPQEVVETQDQAEIERHEVQRLAGLQTLEVLNARVGYADTVTRIAREYLLKARVEYPGVSQLIEERFWYEVEALARVTNHKSLVKEFGCMTDLYEAGNPPDLEIGTFQMAMWAFIADPKARQIPSPDYQERFGSDDQLEVLLQKSKDYPEGYDEKENLRKFVETQEALYMRQHEHRAAVLQYLVECERRYGEIIEKQHSVEQQRRVQQRRQEESDKREEKKDLRAQQKFIEEQRREEANRFERERRREQEYAEQERAEYERAKQELREQERLEQEQMEQKRSRREREHEVPEQLGEHPEDSLFGAGPNEGFNPFDGGDEAVDNLFDDSAPTPLRRSKRSGPSHELTGMDSGNEEEVGIASRRGSRGNAE
ncbi:hypothetical protein BT96DRAFT_936536 [Gymnopus androsaceus JB14]|uniref:Uncharacterized protein n=1 Tax=Gymnopus androsaceus JB14 TaxID=1447944 RepID=A0A6A4HYS1_9AGAR|nr:hypothetical protein BT96DRAFT_936536 [Gymnopus androsaceus JB14]